MARKFMPEEQVAQERWRDQDVQRFASYSDDARQHAEGRNNRVVSVLCYLQLMRSAGLLDSAASAASGEPGEEAEVLTEVLRAEFQNYKAPGGQQAAHYLPGQLKINGHNPWDGIKDPSTSEAFRTLFAEVDTLPANFNKADTQAESSGLCRALALAAADILRQAVPSTPPVLDRPLIERVYHSTWAPHAQHAYALAMERKGQKYTQPPIKLGTPGGVHFNEITNLKERENLSPYQWAITVQRYILERYAEQTQQEPRALHDSTMGNIAGAFKP